MLRLTRTLLQQQPYLYQPLRLTSRLFATNATPTEDLRPVKTIKDKNGVTEVYIVHRSDNDKKKKTKRKPRKPASKKPLLSERLKNITNAGKEGETDTKKHTEADSENTKIKQAINVKWTRISENSKYERVEPATQVEVPKLAHGLDRVLFNPGVHYLKDPRTKHFNFTPFLENITQPVEFDYEALTPYITSSKDNSLIDLAKDLKKNYVGSTSSVSAVLSHFYFVMSNFKAVNTSCLSRAFDKESTKFTRGTRTAASIYLRYKQDGVYAVDVDKSHDVDETVLSVMGKSLEKVLTLEPSEFERFLKENSDQITEQEKNQPESYAYGQLGKFLLRSQLDCFDPRLPRGTFDLKTRAAIPVRLDIQNYSDYVGYSLKRAHGLYESFEREYYDMIRSAFLKYSFQVRIGHMDGILVAYHNTRKIFGFQYISREEMDSRLFGSTKIGDTVFRNALVMFESVLDKATEKYPQRTLRLSFDTRADKTSRATTNIYVEAVPKEDEEQKNQDENLDEFFQTDGEEENNTVLDPYDKITMYELSTQSHVNGHLIEGPLVMDKPSKDLWHVKYRITEKTDMDDAHIKNKFKAMRKRQAEVYSPAIKKVNPMLKKFKAMSDQNLKQEQKDDAAPTSEQ